MSLPASTEINTMQYSFDGTPFGEYQLGTVDTNTMQYSIDGTPIYAQAGTSSSTAAVQSNFFLFM